MKNILPADILKIHECFKASNKKLYVVGGCVRDFILGKVAHDIDLVTDALPDESKQILKNFNVSDEQGKNFGVLRIYTDDCPLGYELAVFRVDTSKGRDTKGGGEKVQYGKHITIEDDVMRRDFTQNALFYDIDNEKIVDLVGGLDDIKNGIIRAVGDPTLRFNEDRLRILRCIRFAARSHYSIDSLTAKAIMVDHRLKNISTLDDVSQERIVEEFKKMSDYCVSNNDLVAWKNYLDYLFHFGLIEEMFSNIMLSKEVSNSNTSNYILTLTFLFLVNAPTSEFKKKLVLDLKFSDKVADAILFFSNYYRYAGNVGWVTHLEKLRNRNSLLTDDLIVEFSNIAGLDSKFTAAFIKYDFSIDGNLVMKEGFMGSDLGIEIKKREIELFYKLLDE